MREWLHESASARAHTTEKRPTIATQNAATSAPAIPYAANPSGIPSATVIAGVTCGFPVPLLASSSRAQRDACDQRPEREHARGARLGDRGVFVACLLRKTQMSSASASRAARPSAITGG